MNGHSMRCFRIAGAVVLLLSAALALANPEIERHGVSLKKSYQNGDWISVTCDVRTPGVCDVETRIGGEIRSIEVDFKKYGVSPDLDRLRLFVLSEDGGDYSFQLSVECAAEDLSLSNDVASSVDCLAGFTIREGEVVQPMYVQILPVTTQALYRQIHPIVSP